MDVGIRLKENITEDLRTEDRDAAAEFIQKEIIGENRWPMTRTEIAEESGWSRQHISNVLRHYFEEVNQPAGDIDTSRFDSVFEAYREGYREGFNDGFDRADSG